MPLCRSSRRWRREEAGRRGKESPGQEGEEGRESSSRERRGEWSLRRSWAGLLYKNTKVHWHR